MTSRSAWRSSTSFVQPLLAALVLTAANAVKPLHVDDTAFFLVARQLAADPLRPYGFEAFWGDVPLPANSILAPAGLPAWWAVGMRLFGDEPVLWKLWLFPLVLALTFGLWDLLRRFARGLEAPLLWGTVLSPALLPGFNLMLDVPALALGVAAFACFLRACDARSAAQAIVAGMLLGWAAQTKYAVLTFCAVIAVAGLVRRRTLLALVALAVAGALFVGWEALVAVQHGESHFLLHARGLHGPETRGAQARLVLPLLTVLGGVGTGAALVGLAGLGASSRVVAAVALVWLLGLSSFAVLPPSLALFESRSPFLHRPFGPGHAVAAGLGMLGVAVWLVCSAKLIRRREQPPARPGSAPPDPEDPAASGGDDHLIAIAWLAIEVAGAVVLSPYAAVRRVLGAVVAGGVVGGSVAAAAFAGSGVRRRVALACVASAVAGTAVAATDLLEARAVARGAELAAARARALDPGSSGRVWYAGHWGFQFQAEREGMLPVVPGRSRLEAGDWLVVPDARVHRQAFAIDVAWAESIDTIVLDDPWPLATLSTMYAGIGPLEGRWGPRLSVNVYRIRRPVVPAP